jgi:hypothetical protein
LEQIQHSSEKKIEKTFETFEFVEFSSLDNKNEGVLKKGVGVK